MLQRRRWGLALGSVVTALGCATFAAGLFDGLDTYGLDLHFRHFGTIKPDPRIVLVDINDHALRVVGDWPWPRRRYAQLVNTLSELGAEAIVLDLVFSDPARPRTVHAGLGPDYDVDKELVELGDRSDDPIIYDDDELRDAIADAGNVYLAMFFRLSPPGVDPEVVLSFALDLVRREPGISPARFNNRLYAAFPDIDKMITGDGFCEQTRIAACLEEDFGLDATGLVEKLGTGRSVNLRTVEEHLPPAKRHVARRRAGHFFDEHPAGKFRSFFNSMLPGRDFHAVTPDRTDLIQAYRAENAFRALANSSVAVPSTLAGHIPHGFDLTLPLDKFAKASKGIGFVSFERELSGGVVREVPPVVAVEGVLVSQLGFLVATDVLGIDPASITWNGERLVFGTDYGRRQLPLSESRRSLINWHVPRGSRRWQDSFEHIPVARVLEIALNREAVLENEKRLGLAIGKLVKRRHAETHAAYTEYVRLINERRALLAKRTGKLSLAHATRREATQVDEAAQLDAKIGRIEEDAILWLRRLHGLWEKQEPLDYQERVERDEIFRLYAELGEGRLAARLHALNDKLTARTNSLLAELRPRMQGKICLVGYTASGVADLVTSPVYDSMPGVMAHANIINMVLQDQPAVHGPAWLNVSIMMVGGVVITVVACARGTVFSGASLLFLVGMFLGVGGVAFRIATFHIASLAAVMQACVVWAFVTAYRQFTEERDRRQFQRALSQYTSPAVAARIAGRANVHDLAPQPARVTCFFSDLYGFTLLSERLGAERTRLVLNPYLRTMSRVLVEHNAVINKFMGDGIFAFFNAPIWPCTNHSEAACACALASLTALDELNRKMCRVESGRRLRNHPGEGPHSEPYLGNDEPLAMRIGISTGEVFVGDYGSDTKLDYTCIGDTVNIAARLEEANKTFGTTILVNDTCRRGAGDGFTFRSLGHIEVMGKTHPVDVYNLVAESCSSHQPSAISRTKAEDPGSRIGD